MNAYERLGVSRDSSHEVIRKAYLKLAKTYHPDKNDTRAINPRDRGTEFVKIQEAWEKLKDAVSRSSYDSRLDEEVGKLEKIGAITEVDLDDMDYDGEKRAFTTPCRCGFIVRISEGELDSGAEETACEGCSMNFRILYEIVSGKEDNHEDEEEGRGA